MLNFKTRKFAHRGLHGDRSEAPENSMEAFRRAVARGYGIEMDIQFSRDHQIVVFHDETLERVCGVPGEIRDYTFEELQNFRLYNSDQRIPLFRDVLKLVDGQVPLIVELKAPFRRYSSQLCGDAARMLDSYHGPYCIESFHPMVVFWFRRHRPRVRRGQLCTDFYRTHAVGHRWQFFFLETMLTNLLTRPDFIAYDHRFRRSLFFRLWKRKITPVAWTVHSTWELQECWNDYEYFIMEQVPCR